MPIDDYYAALWMSHVQVSTATHESLGIATLEAMATPNHCLLPRRGVYPEISGHDADVLYEEADELLERLVTVVEDPGLRARVGGRLSTRVRALYSPGRVARAVAEVVESAVSAAVRMARGVVPVFGWISPGAVVYAGVRLRLADVDLGLHSSWEAITRRLSARTRAVVIVHMRGYPCSDTDRIANELRQRDIALVEDCAQGWGARIGGRGVGTFGDYAFFSLQHYKLIVTGEGGLLTARDSSAMERLRWLSGRTNAKDRTHSWPRNVRMAEAQAAMGLPQLARFDRTVRDLRLLAIEMSTGSPALQESRRSPSMPI